MKEAMVGFFDNYAFWIIFIHVLSAIVWVGGMIAMRLAVYPTLQHIEDTKVRLARTLEISERLFNIVLPFIILLLLTGFVMVAARGTNQIIDLKIAVWTIMTVNYGWMIMRRNKAQRHFISGDYAGVKKEMLPIALWMLPLNVLLGIIAIAAGVILRGV